METNCTCTRPEWNWLWACKHKSAKLSARNARKMENTHRKSERERERGEEEAPLTVLLSGALSHIRLPPLSYDYSGMSKLIWEFSIGSTKYTYDRHIKVCTALCVYSKFYLFWVIQFIFDRRACQTQHTQREGEKESERGKGVERARAQAIKNLGYKLSTRLHANYLRQQLPKCVCVRITLSMTVYTFVHCRPE